MKPIQEVYPNFDYKNYNIAAEYDSMLDSFGYDIVVKEDDDGYQGDSFVLFKNESSYGILVFGWGSCSGCDMLQMCRTYDELSELQTRLFDSISWYSTLKECQESMINEDSELQWYGSSNGFIEFKKAVLAYEE